jgi:Domain of unknown function (DUF4168)
MSRPLLLGTIMAVSLLGGIIPDVTASHPDRMFASAVQANEFTDSILRKYARSLMAMEPRRQEALSTIRELNGGQLPNLICNQPQTMSSLTEKAKSRFILYCNECRDIAASNGLSMEVFNAVTERLQSDSTLKNRILNFMN